MKPSTILKKARRLLTNPKRWTKGADAADGNGFSVDIRSRRAKCFCAGGACERVAPPDSTIWDGALNDALEHLRYSTRNRELVDYNDAKRRKHPDILTWFDRAITRALKAES